MPPRGPLASARAGGGSPAQRVIADITDEASIDPVQVAFMTARIPMKRCGIPEEVAAVARWIVLREASFKAGFSLDLTGDRAIYWRAFNSVRRAQR